MSGYDFDYLKGTVSQPLTKALAQLSLHQPDDPVEYIGNYLLKHVENVKAKKYQETVDLEIKRMDLEKTHQEQTKEQRRHELEIQSEKLKILENETKEFFLHHHVEEMSLLLTKLFDILQVVLIGVEHIYFGKLEQDSDGKQFICYTHSTPASLDILGKYLASGKGVTFELWEPLSIPTTNNNIPSSTKPSSTTKTTAPPTKPTQPTKPSTNNSSAKKPPNQDMDKSSSSSNVSPSPPPQYIHITNTIREKKMEFFGVPLLGEYLALPVVYESCFHCDVLDISLEEEEDPTLAKITKTVHGVVGMHTMGKNLHFTENDIQKALEWIQLYIEAVTRCENAIFLKEIQEKKHQLGNLAQYQEIVQKIRSQPVEQTEDNPQNQCLFKWKTALSEITAIQERITDMQNRKIPFKPPVIQIIDCTLVLLGFDRLAYINPALNLPDWHKMRSSFSSSAFLERLLNTTAPTLETLSPEMIAGAKQLLSDINSEQLHSLSFEGGIFYDWASTVIDLGEAIQDSTKIEDTED